MRDADASMTRKAGIGVLREPVVAALSTLIRGTAGPRVLADLVRLVLRVVVLAFAEARGLTAADGEGSLAWAGAAPVGQVWTRLRDAVRAREGGPFAEGALPEPPIEDAAARALIEGLRGAAIPWSELDVEEIGAAYEAVVGFELREARGATVVLLPDHTGVDLEEILATPPAERAAKLDARGRLASAVAQAGSVEALRAALARRLSPRWPDRMEVGALYLEPGLGRRRAGAHYTPRAITRALVDRTLAPLLDPLGYDVERILALRVCDPAMGSGAFLLEACRQIAARIAACGGDPVEARRRVAERCLSGVDKDPLAVELARASLWLLAGSRADHALRCGDALIGVGPAGGPGRAAVEGLCRGTDRVPFHWPDEMPEVFAARGGLDAFVGNPPWVAYAGRAAQPLEDDLFDFYLRYYPSFHGYRTLHGLFVYRAASLLRPGGRLGLVVPTSIADLGGYEPVRRAHDALAEIDAELLDFGNAFEGVFQPSMGLCSTRRPAPAAPPATTWNVARDDLDPTARALLDRLGALPPLPASCFGERGFQTQGDDVARLVACAAPRPPFVVPIREGTDVRAFRALPVRLHLDPDGLAGKLRDAASFREVAVLVRQTARFPIAALSDGMAFRNSILACFAAEGRDRFTLLAWLNAAPVRWLHFMRFRDARQGMPQVKIAHLRAVPDPPAAHRAKIAAMGEVLGARNAGVTGEEQAALDEAVADALDLSPGERALVAAWAAKNPAP